jgi:hypothetical protein
MRGVNRQYNLSDVSDPDKVPWAHWFKNAEYARATGIGVHEGGNASVKGQWRPTPGQCCMAGGGPFCAVCREQIMLMIYNRVTPMDDSTPNGDPIVVKVKKSGENWSLVDPKVIPWILPLQPQTHKLTVKWALKQAAMEAGPDTSTAPKQPPPFDPTNKGNGEDGTSDMYFMPERVYTKIPFEGDALGSLPRPDPGRNRPIESPDITKVKWSPGRWILTVEVRDEMFYDLRDPLTKKAVKVPWVVKDENNFMVERRAWELAVRE